MFMKKLGKIVQNLINVMEQNLQHLVNSIIYNHIMVNVLKNVHIYNFNIHHHKLHVHKTMVVIQHIILKENY